MKKHLRASVQATISHLFFLFVACLSCWGQGTAFTYQGRLIDGAGSATGLYDLRFAVYDAAASGTAVSGTLTNAATPVTNGLFTVALDFGAGVFTGATRWLDISVRTNGAGAFAALAPRQALAAVPYAIAAASAANAASAGFATSAATVPAGGITSGTANINISGNAASATTAAVAGSAVMANSAVAAITAATATNLVGILPDTQLSANVPRLNGTNWFTGTNTLSNVLVATNPANRLFGTFTGSGAGLSNLSSVSLAPGSITAAMLSPGAVTALSGAGGTPLNAVTVSSNGFVGVGTSAPTAGLQISTTAVGTVLPVLYEVQNGQSGYTNLQYATSTAINGNLLAVGANRGVTLVDISNPGLPSLQAQLVNGSGGITDLAAVYGLAWAGSNLVAGAYGSSAVSIFSCLNPASPLRIAELRSGVGGWNYLSEPSSVAISGNLLAIGDELGNAVTLADISNPATPMLKSTIVNGAYGFTNLSWVRSVALNGNLLAIGAFSSSAVTLVDVSAPANPVKLAELRDGVGGFSLAGVCSVALSGNLLAIGASTSNTVTLVDLSVPSSPVKLAELRDGVGGYSINGIASVAFAGNRLAICTRLGVTLTDVRSPASPALLASAVGGINGADYLGGALSVSFAGTNLVASSSPGAFTILGIGTQSIGLESAGWVGIGTTHPAAALDVVGNVLVENAALFNVSASRVAIGLNASVSGSNSAALGYGAAAAGYNATALGYSVTASGVNSTAVGNATIAGGTNSTALGFTSHATGDFSTALGDNTFATGSSATAVGYAVNATGADALALGYVSTASGVDSAAVGSQAIANNSGSIALGNLAHAFGSSSTSLGYGSAATGSDATALGFLAHAYGDYSTALGYNANATGTNAVAIGGTCIASGDYSTALGYFSQATNTGCLVWSDNNGLSTGALSTNNNSVTLRASGGYRLFANSAMTAGVFLAPGGAAWASISDQDSKKNFAPVNGELVLDKLAAVPVQQWNYQWEQDTDTPNIGPMAQAFKAAFYPGRDNTCITTLEFDGVELAAIQGLNRKLEEKEAQLQEQSAQIAELKARLERLELLVKAKH